MGFVRSALTFVIFSAIVATPSALSAPTKKTTKTLKKGPTARATLEVYPALEEIVIDPENEVTEIEGMPATPATPSIATLDAQAKTKALEERLAVLEKKASAPIMTDSVKTQASAPVAPLIVEKRETLAYYPVPAGKTSQLTKRLRLVQAILEESGRAYDYRTVTTQKLEEILRQIRANKPTDEEVRMLLAE